ncbi:MAG: hypothetical protein RL748_2382 [Pseudomonadota bacterium]|jgi:hypothetical protein
MKILMLDDEEYTMADHREALESQGHIVYATTTLKQATTVLQAGFVDLEKQIDFVVIDLMLEEPLVTGSIAGLNKNKDSLNDYYKNLKAQKLNQGQALGQWLWERGGRIQHENGPMHCYFSNVPDLYQFHNAKNQQEFWRGADSEEVDKNKVREFVLDKTVIAPNEFPTAIQKIVVLWNKRGWVTK